MQMFLQYTYYSVLLPYGSTICIGLQVLVCSADIVRSKITFDCRIACTRVSLISQEYNHMELGVMAQGHAIT
jgi:hypothetical protein